MEKDPALRWAVLVVEDNPDHVWMLQRTLTQSGRIDVTVARSAKEAREAASRRSFDAVVTDQRLPDAEGLQLIREMRGKGFAGTILLVTALASEEMATRGLAAGATDYVFKARGYADRVRDELLSHLDAHA